VGLRLLHGILSGQQISETGLIGLFSIVAFPYTTSPIRGTNQTSAPHTQKQSSPSATQRDAAPQSLASPDFFRVPAAAETAPGRAADSARNRNQFERRLI
jgi:hypothetical protein